MLLTVEPFSSPSSEFLNVFTVYMSFYYSVVWIKFCKSGNLELGASYHPSRHATILLLRELDNDSGSCVSGIEDTG